MHNTIIVNLYAGSGAGKTTCAWIIAAELKKRGVVTEYVPEYAKELVWEKRFDLLDGSYQNQYAVFAEQNRRLQRLVGQVEVVVTDSPLLLSAVYAQERKNDMAAVALKQHHNYRNFNLFINRGRSFEKQGRIHTHDESKRIDAEIRSFLDQNNIYYGVYYHQTVPIIVDNIQKHLNTMKSRGQLARDDLSNPHSSGIRFAPMNDWDMTKDYQGAERFHDGSRPLLAETKFADIIVSGIPEEKHKVYVFVSPYHDPTHFFQCKMPSKEIALQIGAELGRFMNTQDEQQFADGRFLLQFKELTSSFKEKSSLRHTLEKNAEKSKVLFSDEQTKPHRKTELEL